MAADDGVRTWRQRHKSTDATCLMSTIQAAGGVMMRGMIFWRTFVTACLSVAADHVYPFMETINHLLMATSRMIMNHVAMIKVVTNLLS